LIKLSLGTSYLSEANKQAGLNGWDNPIIEYVSPNFVLNDDAYNYFLLYGKTLDNIKIQREPFMKWYNIVIYSFIAGYFTNTLVK